MSSTVDADQRVPGLTLEHHAAHSPDRTAIAMADGSDAMTYAELRDESNRHARSFRTLGLAVGDHVALCLENTPSAVAVVWGAHLAGLYYTVCSTRLAPAELGYIIDDCGATVAVLSARHAEAAVEVIAMTPHVEHRMSIGGEIPGHVSIEMLSTNESTAPWDETAVAGRDMLYSSGTTGRPKGIKPPVLRASLAEPLIVVPMLLNQLGVVPGESVLLSPAPVYHSAPLRYLMSMTQVGGTVLLMDRFDAAATLESLKSQGVTHALMVPTMLVRLLKLDVDVRDSFETSGLRAVVHGGGPCPPEIKEQIIDWWGPVVHEYFGATEATGMTWATSEEWLAHRGTVGRAILGSLRIVGDDGHVLPARQTGAVYFADGPVFEYHNDESRTLQAHNASGWSTYGDVGHLDEDGFLYLTDRSEFVVISGGVNIYPQEAEDILLSHPDVLDAAVFGVPDPEYGERLQAVVQPAVMPADDIAADALAATLAAHCASRLSGFKCPRSIDFRSELPRHDTGKLYKRLLRDQYSDLT